MYSILYSIKFVYLTSKYQNIKRIVCIDLYKKDGEVGEWEIL